MDFLSALDCSSSMVRVIIDKSDEWTLYTSIKEFEYFKPMNDGTYLVLHSDEDSPWLVKSICDNKYKLIGAEDERQRKWFF